MFLESLNFFKIFLLILNLVHYFSVCKGTFNNESKNNKLIAFLSFLAMKLNFAYSSNNSNLASCPILGQLKK
jgi:hypothetical protein